VSLPEIHGLAIVSDDDRIADSSGAMPLGLRNDADWAYFQTELDRAQLVALGRASHQAAPNVRRRPRLVLSHSVATLERRADAWWWNPDGRSWPEVAAEILPRGGRVGVPGGQGPFDAFLKIGFSAFHLSRAHGVKLPGGRGLFAACETGDPAAAVLGWAGLRAGETRRLDPSGGVTLTVWRS
jgi:hypothetical protein